MVVMGVWVSFWLLARLWACVALCGWLWRQVYRRARAGSEESQPNDPKAHLRAKPDWVLRRVLYLAIHLPSCRRITTAFNRWHGGRMTVGKSWLAEVVKAHEAVIADRRRAMRRRLPALVAVCHTWALDLTFVTSPDGLTFTVLGVVDHGSRRLLCLKVLPSKCAFTLLGCLLFTFASFGMPKVIRTDNEGMFTGQLWRGVLQALGILARRGPLMQPWRNGRIERVFGTLKPLLRKIQPIDARALRALLNEFITFYNCVRPHQNLAGLTPNEAWLGRTLADVQSTNDQNKPQWVQALNGLLVGYRRSHAVLALRAKCIFDR